MFMAAVPTSIWMLGSRYDLDKVFAGEVQVDTDDDQGGGPGPDTRSDRPNQLE